MSSNPRLLRFLIFIDTLAVVPSLILIIPAGMLCDGGYTTRAYIGFYTLLVIPISVIAGLFLAIRFRSQGCDRKATLAAGAPLVYSFAALVILAII